MASKHLHAVEKPRYSKYYVRRRRNQMSEVEDRLSSLPDAILIDILSRLFIDEAAATSVLSRRWLHLWTGVTRFVFRRVSVLRGDSENSFRVLADFLRQLTSPQLSVFDVRVPTPWPPSSFNDAESCFRELGCRNVEHVRIDTYDEARPGYPPYSNFEAPACLFRTQTLITLRLAFFTIVLPDDIPTIQLGPKLKTLELATLDNFPCWLGTLLSSCPLLEHLKLSFTQDPPQPSVLRIRAPNLRSLCIGRDSTRTPCVKISIDAPSLTSLGIFDHTSYFRFVQKPSGLIRELIESRIDTVYGDIPEWMAVVDQQEDYLYQMSKFVARMPSVCQLKLQLESVQYSENSNVPNGCKDLLFCLHCVPNLSHLILIMDVDHPFETHDNWCVPDDSVPDCLVRKLKTVQVSMKLNMTDDELIKLPAYILSNALVLEKLDLCVETREARLHNADNFRRSVLNLPRGSSACEIVFSSYDQFMRASSNDFKNGLLIT